MLSEKQKKIFAFAESDYDALICDGAIRSGKTSVMTVAFVDWAMANFSGQRFGICGKTADGAIKNIILPFMSMSYSNKKYHIRWKPSSKVMEVSQGSVRNVFEVFGGKDESSFMLIQGRTFAGALIDEVALMPKSFVSQAVARCSVDGSKLWFSCNPESPEHWFYREWILKADERNVLYLHFNLEDNPSLSKKIIERYKSYYSGAFYERYIEGRWILAEGLVYDMSEEYLTDEIPAHGEYYISCDYGTMNPCSMGLWCVSNGVATRISEYYYDGRAEKKQLTDEDYYLALEALASDLPVRYVIIDPSASSFITLIRKKGKFRVKKADNDVMNGIRLTAGFLKSGKLKIHRSCKNALREFSLYRWDDKSGNDKVVKENDHAMDEIRYFSSTILAKRRTEQGLSDLRLL
ncbi:MAG: PBSX family phage terminase large subunit [Oscillospiraceae bacterium]|nr:PBSX family phage terminase large subunit [Oscillospiraceae bacterium]